MPSFVEANFFDDAHQPSVLSHGARTWAVVPFPAQWDPKLGIHVT